MTFFKTQGLYHLNVSLLVCNYSNNEIKCNYQIFLHISFFIISLNVNLLVRSFKIKCAIMNRRTSTPNTLLWLLCKRTISTDTLPLFTSFDDIEVLPPMEYEKTEEPNTQPCKQVSRSLLPLPDIYMYACL